MKRFIISCAMSLIVIAMNAKVTLPSVFSDNMVLQQSADVVFWGKAEPGSMVTIRTSWTMERYRVKADEEGRWTLRVKTPAAGGPYEVTVSDGEKMTLKNVLIGEVWICMGQSNMAMRMKGSTGQPVNGAADFILKAKPTTMIRSCNLKNRVSVKPEDDCPATWYENTPKGVAEASAVAYFFAKYLNEALNVPVGIINASWGGTPIEAWMCQEVLEREFSNELNLNHFKTGELPAKNSQFAPGTLYNGMLHSLVPFTAKGFLWYQGCANRNRWEQYKRLQPEFVNMLRQKWGDEKLPFYFTQIAPYQYKDPDSREAAYMMWAQAQTLEHIPYSGMATTHDVGERNCIHPADKKQVGERLAYLALTNNYNIEGIDAKPPMPVSFIFKDGAAFVSFDAGKLGISPINTELEGCFELAGEDKVFYPATAIVEKDRRSIKVYSQEVPSPVAVRYGMRNWSEALLFNCYGVPVTPFRSDDWK